MTRNSRPGSLIPSRFHRFLTLGLLGLLVSIGVSLEASNYNAYPLSEDRGTAGILGALEKLPVYARVLHITAHPDDENSATLTWLARKVHARTALLSLTRGDGGQNVLGDEKYEAMGLIRTGELLEACRIYGVETYFTTVFEFGFSKSAPETLTKWGHEATLEEVVRFIRMWRPTIVIAKFLGTSRDGHGHHQTAGLIAHEAFRTAGDAKRFPEHARLGLGPWQAKKLYENVRGGDDSSRGPADGIVRVDVGASDPVLGRSYRQIASEGYSKHRSQGNAASFSPPGPASDSFRLVDSTVQGTARETGFFDSLDTSLQGIAELAGAEADRLPFLKKALTEAQAAAVAALREFRPRQPAASAPEAIKGVAVLRECLRQLESSSTAPALKAMLQDSLQEKLRDFEDAVHATLGIYLVGRAEEATAVPDQTVPVPVTFFNRGSELVDLKRVTLWTPEGWRTSLPANPPLGSVQPAGQALFNHSVQLSPTASVTQPFWYRKGKEDARYQTRPTRNVFAPFDEPEITAQAAYRYREVELSIRTPVRAQVNDPIRGAEFHDFQVVPLLSVGLEPEVTVVPISTQPQTCEFKARLVYNERSPGRGTVDLVPPAGWQVTPSSVPFELSRKGESFTAAFSVRVPAGTRAGAYPIEAVAKLKGAEFRSGYRVVSYPENWTRYLYEPSRVDVKVFEVKVKPDLTVGYIPGAGDEVPETLRALGAKVQMLTGEDLATGNLKRFSAIITGIRAYNVNDELRASNRRLLDYVEQGGKLIVQYNTPGRGAFPYGPYPMTASTGDRITVEESPVVMLKPEHPIFTTPNRIAAADFEGWVQERGLYFMSQWDPRYTAILSGSDPGEEPKNGGMLVARVGQGYYLFTAYAWFRQLPAGVPGAFRIFANILSAEW